MKKKKIGLCILILGACIFTYPFLSMSIDDITQVQRNSEFDREIASDIKINEKRELIKNGSKSDLTDNGKMFNVFESDVKISDDVSKYDVQKLKKHGIDLNKKLGYVKIPKLGQTFDLYLDADYVKISKGVAVLRGSDPPVGGIGKRSVIAGHNGYYNKPIFLHINKLENNDEIIVNFLGEEVKYKVFGKEIIPPTGWEKLEPVPDEDMLTLLTCIQIPRYNHRLLVNAKRVNVVDEKNGNQTPNDREAINEKENGKYTFFGYMFNNEYSWSIKIRRFIPYIFSLIGILIIAFAIVKMKKIK